MNQPKPRLAYIVLYTPQLAKTVQFYQTLGLDFQPEKHGDGPSHFSANVGHLILEIYPTNQMQSKEMWQQRLGFTVSSVFETWMSLVDRGAECHTPPSADGQGDFHAVVLDPDGRTVELLQEK